MWEYWSGYRAVGLRSGNRSTILCLTKKTLKTFCHCDCEQILWSIFLVFSTILPQAGHKLFIVAFACGSFRVTGQLISWYFGYKCAILNLNVIIKVKSHKPPHNTHKPFVALLNVEKSSWGGVHIVLIGTSFHSTMHCLMLMSCHKPTR